MTVIHHPVLRVNADVPDDHIEILADSGWIAGSHPDTDPDYPMRVLEVVELAPVSDVSELSDPPRKTRTPKE